MGNDLPPLPRVGINLQIPSEYNQFSWYGRGPHESYWDRKTSAIIGVYHGSVEDQYIPYVMPQENGNKTDARWASLTNESGSGLLVAAMPVMEVSVHHYSIDNLTRAKHTNEIMRSGTITWNLDLHQMGVGGDDSWNPRTHKEYLLFPGTYIYSVRFVPISSSLSEAVKDIKYDLPALCAPVIEVHDSQTEHMDEVIIKGSSSESEIYYSTDGSAPDKNSQKYTGKFLVRDNTLIQAAEYKDGFITSVVSYAD